VFLNRVTVKFLIIVNNLCGAITWIAYRYYSWLVLWGVVRLLNLGVRGQCPCRAPFVKDVVIILVYVVLDSNQLVAWSVVSAGYRHLLSP
jgi:hypothetical protein